jgi:hypothetical protein
MSKHNIFEVKDRDTISDSLIEMLRTGSQQLIYQAVQIELEALLAANKHRLTADGKAAVVGNAHRKKFANRAVLINADRRLIPWIS